MTNHPSDAQLLAATIDFLENDLLPELNGEHRFKTRLAANALKIMQRGLAIGREATSEKALESAPNWVEKIRQKEVALDDPVVLHELEQQLRESLQINNPKWLIE